MLRVDVRFDMGTNIMRPADTPYVGSMSFCGLPG